MFNEELDLGEVAAEEKEGGARKAEHLIKQEVQECSAQREGVCRSAASVSQVSFQTNYQSVRPFISSMNTLPPLQVEESASGAVIHPQVNAGKGGKVSGLFRHWQVVSVVMVKPLLFLCSSNRCPETVWLPLILPAVCVHLPSSGSPHLPSH